MQGNWQSGYTRSKGGINLEPEDPLQCKLAILKVFYEQLPTLNLILKALHAGNLSNQRWELNPRFSFVLCVLLSASAVHCFSQFSVRN